MLHTTTNSTSKRAQISRESTYSISSLSKEFGISTRSVRFYEEIGLIFPQRGPGGQRVFNSDDRARLKLILRGKRFGLALEEIVAILGKANHRLGEKEQIRNALRYGEIYLTKVRTQIAELRQIEREMLEHGKGCIARLRELGGSQKEITHFLKTVQIMRGNR